MLQMTQMAHGAMGSAPLRYYGWGWKVLELRIGGHPIDHCPGGPSNAWPDASFIFVGLRPSRAVHTSRVSVKLISYTEKRTRKRRSISPPVEGGGDRVAQG